MHPKLRNILFAGITITFTSMIISTSAQAHVTVKPTEAAPASYQTFTVSVPNEKAQPTTRIKLLIPSGLDNVTPTQKPGWAINIEKKTNDSITAITWSGGDIDEGLRDDFTFSAKLPVAPGNIEWKAYQTYADGTVVAWDQPDSSEGHSEKDKGPFSVTAVKEPADTAQENGQPSDTSFYIAVAALLVALISVFFSTRKTN
jgi:uncharacterized protein YcnI